ncbi:helix-turn-helix domain-containing protein [Alteromonas sp. H39]|uniref:AraC family transcriptional regulator n=1 Tax=Alteromonas sp. H39 TaxID=3389876 RepID=UPI0039E1E552
MTESLSIRSYTLTMDSHTHDYCQMVLPLHGNIEMAMDNYQGAVGVGEAIVIAPGQQHGFRANDASRFVVADLSDVPASAHLPDSPLLSLDKATQLYLLFIEAKLATDTSGQDMSMLVQLFKQLINALTAPGVTDPRISAVKAHIHDNLASALPLAELADVACLGVTQLKKRFKAATGITCGQYITQERMKTARALLTHTDLPVYRVAQEAGYTDLSAFSRRFAAFFGESPSAYSAKRT